MEIVMKSVADLIPYARNARTHTEAQVVQIASSIREFGFTNPVLIDEENGIIAGHGRVLAAQKLGMADVPCIPLSHLTKAQKRAYMIADNKLALNAGWDEELLKLELDELRDLNFDLDITGFDGEEIEALDAVFGGEGGEGGEGEGGEGEGEESKYTRKIISPVYEITGENPPVAELYDREKTEVLLREIDGADLPDEVAAFLRAAAERHTVFNFAKIAEFYAHADADLQNLMERSALVIIDFDRAIEEGFVTLTSAVAEQFRRDYPEGEEPGEENNGEDGEDDEE